MTDDITKADRPWYWDVTWYAHLSPTNRSQVQWSIKTVDDPNRSFDKDGAEIDYSVAGIFGDPNHNNERHARLIASAPATARERDELRERLTRVEGALRLADDWFNRPSKTFMELHKETGQSLPELSRARLEQREAVVSAIRAALAEGGVS